MNTTSRDQVLSLFTAAVVMFAVSAYIIFVARIGPVIRVISQSQGHGVHMGDLIGVATGIVGLACLVAAIRRA